MRILLIEDDKALAQMYASKFKVEGWETIICDDGGEALTTAKEVDPNVIILDLMLPGISGVDVLQILRSEAKTVRTPVIVYTNFGDNFNREKCLTCGADEFILKVDSTPEFMAETVRKVLMLKDVEGLEEQRR